MLFFDDFFLWLARWDGIPGFLASLEVWTNMMCSAADIIFTFWFLRVADLARKDQGRRPVRLRYVALAVCLLLTPILAFLQGPVLMIWTSLILGIPYLILAGSVLIEIRGIVRLVGKRIRNARPSERSA